MAGKKNGNGNVLFYGDNLDILRAPDKLGRASGTFDLIYLDPPFNSNRSYNVLFADRGAPGPFVKPLALGLEAQITGAIQSRGGKASSPTVAVLGSVEADWNMRHCLDWLERCNRQR